MMRDNRMPLGQIMVLLFILTVIMIVLLMPQSHPLTLAFSQYDNLDTETSSQIYLLNLETKAVRQITHSPDVKLHLSWSPDGQKLVYGGYGIRWLDVEGYQEHELISNAYYIYQINWSSDSRYVIFSAYKNSNNSGLYII